MKLTGQQRQQIHDAILHSFSEDELHRLVRFELDEDLNAIGKRGSRSEQVFCLAEWAARTDRVADLLRGAYNQNPDNATLDALVQHACDWPELSEYGLTLVDNKAYTFAPRQVEREYLDGLVADYQKYADRYTPLRGIAEVQRVLAGGIDLSISKPFIPAGFEKLVEHGFGPQRKVERVEVDDLRTAVAQYRRLVLLGEPGAGKTTTLWRLAYDYAKEAWEDKSHPLPVLVSLGGYRGKDSALAYVASQTSVLGRHLPAYLHHRRVILLLDALNEMPRRDYGERVGRIQLLLRRYDELPVVVSCRLLDYRDTLQLEKLEIKPLDMHQQRVDLNNYLGEHHGGQLLGQLKAGRLLDLGTNPFMLVMFAQVYASEQVLPQNRGKLFAAFVDTLLEREPATQSRH